MKKTFTIAEFKNAAGCWRQKPHALNDLIENLQISGNIHTVDVMYSSFIPLQDKRWWLFNSCEMLTSEKVELGLRCAEYVESIYSRKYPDDLRVSECNIATRKFLKGEITREELNVKRYADAAADAAAYAAAAYAAAAADAAYADAAYAAAAYADAAAAAAAYADAAAADAAYAAAADAADAAYAAAADAADAAAADAADAAAAYADAAYADAAYAAYAADAYAALIMVFLNFINEG